MPVVIVPEAYRGPTRGQGQIHVEGETVRDCIEAVEAGNPGFRELVIDASGAAHRFVSFFVNDEQLVSDVLDTKLHDGDRLEILAAIAGG